MEQVDAESTEQSVRLSPGVDWSQKFRPGAFTVTDLVLSQSRSPSVVYAVQVMAAPGAAPALLIMKLAGFGTISPPTAIVPSWSKS
jgi:hypothetical protein